MEQQYLDMLEFLESTGESSLFAQRESGFVRIPYAMEKTLYGFIRDGKPKEMIAFYKQMLTRTPQLKVPIGKTSADRLRQLKYAAVSAIALACRYAIDGGAIEAAAYSMSDDAIYRIDTMRTPLDVLKSEVRSLIGFAELVNNTRSLLSYSPIVKSCIEYITVNSHHNIALEELSSGTPYSKEYISKLFKKEVGISVSDFILKTRTDEAMALLKAGNSCNYVAHTLGFSSQSYFIRQFKRATGMTPRAYRAINL